MHSLIEMHHHQEQACSITSDAVSFIMLQLKTAISSYIDLKARVDLFSLSHPWEHCDSAGNKPQGAVGL